jgi:hypothetical protein
MRCANGFLGNNRETAKFAPPSTPSLGPQEDMPGKYRKISYSLIPFSLSLMLCFGCPLTSNVGFLKERFSMEWTTPQHEEIDLNCEVSSYANAEL